jgi:hypothetical protein
LHDGCENPSEHKDGGESILFLAPSSNLCGQQQQWKGTNVGLQHTGVITAQNCLMHCDLPALQRAIRKQRAEMAKYLFFFITVMVLKTFGTVPWSKSILVSITHLKLNAAGICLMNKNTCFVPYI